MTVSFIVEGQPQGKARHRSVNVNGRIRTYTPKQTMEYEEKIRAEYIRQCNKYFGKSAICVNILAYFSIPKSTSKKKKKLMLENKILPKIDPDEDNIRKVVLDALQVDKKRKQEIKALNCQETDNNFFNAAFYDDCQSVGGYIFKRYSEIPRIEVTIYNLEELEDE